MGGEELPRCLQSAPLCRKHTRGNSGLKSRSTLGSGGTPDLMSATHQWQPVGNPPRTHLRRRLAAPGETDTPGCNLCRPVRPGRCLRRRRSCYFLGLAWSSRFARVRGARLGPLAMAIISPAGLFGHPTGARTTHPLPARERAHAPSPAISRGSPPPSPQSLWQHLIQDPARTGWFYRAPGPQGSTAGL